MVKRKQNQFEKDFNLPRYKQISAIPLILFNIYVIIWWLEIGKRISFLGAIRFEFLLGSILGVLALNNYFRNSRKEANNSGIVFAVFLFLVVLFASLPLAVNLKIAWQAYIDKVIKYALMTFFISQFVVSPTTLKYFLFSSFLAFFKIGQEAFHGTVTGNMIWYNQGIPRLHGTPETMFGHPNSLSGKIVSSLSFIWYSFPIVQKNWLKILIAIQLLFSLNIILRTGSRTGYVTFIVLVLLIIALSRKKFIAFTLAIILTAMSIQYIPEDYAGRFKSTFVGQEEQGKSKEARMNLFKDSFKVFTENPLGVGLYCFPLVQKKAGRNPQETHNLYTQLLSETGIQGFLCFMLLIVLILKKIGTTKRGFSLNIERLTGFKASIEKNQDQKALFEKEIFENKMLLAITNALFVFVVMRLILGLFGHDLLEIYWWISAGMVIALNNILSTSAKRVDYFLKNNLSNPITI